MAYKLKCKLKYFTPYRKSEGEYGSGKYEVTLSNLDDFEENKEVLAQLPNLHIRDGEKIAAKLAIDGRESNKASFGRFVTGKSLYPINTVDSARNNWPQQLLIGNDTVAVVRFTTWTIPRGDYKGKESLTPKSVQIIDYVPYENPDAEEGFVLPEELRGMPRVRIEESTPSAPPNQSSPPPFDMDDTPSDDTDFG